LRSFGGVAQAVRAQDSYPPRRTWVLSLRDRVLFISKALLMLYTVYILFSEKYNKHYTGYTSNLQDRLKSHNELGKEWTARFRPWKLIFSKKFKLKSDAMAYERWLKTGVGRAFILTLSH
jgi:putative endonuclease